VKRAFSSVVVDERFGPGNSNPRVIVRVEQATVTLFAAGTIQIQPPNSQNEIVVALNALKTKYDKMPPSELHELAATFEENAVLRHRVAQLEGSIDVLMKQCKSLEEENQILKADRDRRECALLCGQFGLDLCDVFLAAVFGAEDPMSWETRNIGKVYRAYENRDRSFALTDSEKSRAQKFVNDVLTPNGLLLRDFVVFATDLKQLRLSPAHDAPRSVMLGLVQNANQFDDWLNSSARRLVCQDTHKTADVLVRALSQVYILTVGFANARS
jgi:hypothetical protein